MLLADYLKALPDGQDDFASRVGVSQGMVSHWVTGRHRVTDRRVLEVAAATGWQVTPHELRPDLYPHPHDGMPRSLCAPAGVAG